MSAPLSAAAPPADPAVPPPAQPWLAGRWAEVASLALFSAGGTWFTEALPFLPPHQAVLAVGATLLGAAGVGVERGAARRPTWAGALGLGLLAAALHVLALLALRGATGPLAALALPGEAGALELALRGLAVALLAPPVIQFATRFDRQEAGWRAAVRRGPPHGATPLAHALATRPLPLPLRLLGWVLLPLDLALRAAALAAILGYQLTFSRLMPPACRYEPTCSRYGFQAFWQHGFLRAGLLTAWRLLRCSPVGSGGYDPMVPPPSRRSAACADPRHAGEARGDG